MTDKGFILNDTKSEKQIVTFKVVGEQKTNVRLNTSEIKLNSKIYSTETPLVLKADEKGDLQFTLLNKTAKIQEVPISFKLYKWNDQIKKNLLKTEKKTYLLKPNTSLNIHYVFDDNKFSLYYLHTIVNYKDSKSELVTSLKRDSVLGSKIDFSSIKKYPIEKEKENGLITCFAPVDFFDSGKVTTVIYDQKDNVIWKEEKNISDIDIKNGLFTAFTPVSYTHLTLPTNREV